jgi:hypothetical protein
MPWLLVPILPLFACSMAITAGLSVWPAYLLVPVAAWLGRRYGTHGIITVAIGTAALLLPVFDLEAFSFGGAPTVYVITLWVAIASASPDPLRALIGSGRLFRSAPFFIAALVLLPMSFGFELHRFDDEGALRLSLALQPLFLFCLFLSGLAGFPPWHAAIGLILAAILGMAIRYSGVEGALAAFIANPADPDGARIGGFWFGYRLDDLAGLATAIACYLAGRLAEQWRAGDQLGSALWRHPFAAVGALTLLAALGTITGLLLPPLPAIAGLTGIYGSYDALVLAAFLAGLLLRHGGVAVCLGLFVALIAAGNAAAFMTGRGVLFVSLEQPLICLAYGALGVGTRALLAGAPIPFRARRWVQYGLLVLGIIAIVTSSSELIEFAAVLLMAAAGALLTLAIRWARRKLDLRGIRITGEGWLQLAAILVVLAWALVNGRLILQVPLDLAEDWDLPAPLAIVALIVLLHLPVALLAAGLARCLPKVWADVKLLARRPEAS